MTTDPFRTRLDEDARLTQERLFAALDGLGPSRVAEAMRHACVGGKRLRGFLAIEGARLYGAEARAVAAAAAIEAMHAYSLVHDDLPCMDDDDLRRGQPTVHVKWDEATAVLAGDALQSLAFALLTGDDGLPGEVQARLVARLAHAAGVAGMVGGQAMDIEAETADTPLTIDDITVLQAGKTGALFDWAATAGAVIAGADPAPLTDYAAAFGLAFQIADDILDVAGDEALTGKRVGKDAKAGKATFVSILGLGGARQQARLLSDRAVAALDGFGAEADSLRAAARFVVERDR